MGYTTQFTGSIELSRKLTMAEAKEILDLDNDATGIDAYFQWVPSKDLGYIVWDREEKFYQYKEQLAWLCGWLHKRDIVANGRFYWQGEDTTDTGTLVVANNTMVAYPDDKPSAKSPQPLTLRDLQEMALEQVTAK